MNKIYIRNILLAVVLFILLVLVFIIKGRSPFGKRESFFASEPEKQITRIELAQDRDNLVLTLDEDIWLVNGKQVARKSPVMFILRILTEMKIKSPVSPELFESEIISKQIKPVRVKVYEKRRLLKSFYVYKTASNRYGNIMKMKERTRPFIVHVPGYETDIGSVFIPRELYWLPFTVFNVLPSEISTVTLENIADPASSFSISNTDSKYRLSDMKDFLSGWDSSRVMRYVSYFTMVPFETWAFDISESEKNRLSSTSPAFRISLKKSDGGEIVLSLWERFQDGKKDPDRLWGKTEDREEFLIIRYFDIDPLLKKISYFYPE
jgi:hypothetical protein